MWMGYWSYFFNHEEWHNLYIKNCSLRSQDEWWAEGEPNIILGLAYFLPALIFEITYIPFLIIMASKEFFHFSCYKLMFLMGIYDIIILPCCGMITGIQVILGAHFCNSPTLFYFSGVIPCVGFHGTMAVCILLAFNRLLEMAFPKYAEILFGGYRTFFWMLIPISYQIYTGFELLHVFAIAVYAMNPDPFFRIAGMQNNPEFNFQKFHRYYIIQNSFCISTMIILYACMLAVLNFKTHNLSSHSKHQKQMTYQALVICGELFFAPLLYAAMLYIEFPIFMEILAHFSWIVMHGDTPLLYFMLNSSLRKSVIKMFRPFVSKTGSHVTKIPNVFHVHPQQQVQAHIN